MKKLVYILLLLATTTWSNNLSITNVQKISDSQLQFDISWDNSWGIVAGGKFYHDAVWVFIKSKGSDGIWSHINSGTTISFASNTLTGLAKSGGFMIFQNTPYSFGSVSDTITINFISSTLGLLPDFKVFGIEMVHINNGSYQLGGGNYSTTNAFTNNFSYDPYTVTTGTIPATGSFGTGGLSLYILGEGGTFTIPSTYPTGFISFYIMKYEISQEQYVAFLNTLSFSQQQGRTASDISTITASNSFVMGNSSTPNNRNGIRASVGTYTSSLNFYCDLNVNNTPNELSDGQNIACSNLSVHDVLAYLDWAALRPMTDMEYEKAARGFGPSGDYATNTQYANGSNTLPVIPTGIVNAGQNDESISNINTNGLINYNFQPLRVGAFATVSSNRSQSGGSYFAVMDLSGSLNEVSVRTTSTIVGSFGYASGDGQLSVAGFSDNFGGVINDFVLKGGAFNTTSTPLLTISNRTKLISGEAQKSDRTLQANGRGCK